jgi:hypothetical protein
VGDRFGDAHRCEPAPIVDATVMLDGLNRWVLCTIIAPARRRGRSSVSDHERCCDDKPAPPIWASISSLE